MKDAPESIHKETYYLCGTCKEKMKMQPSGDFMAFLSGGPYYCENKECDKFGYLTMAGIKLEEYPPTP